MSWFSIYTYKLFGSRGLKSFEIKILKIIDVCILESFTTNILYFFRLQNKICEFTTRAHKFKVLFSTEKQVSNATSKTSDE